MVLAGASARWYCFCTSSSTIARKRSGLLRLLADRDVIQNCSQVARRVTGECEERHRLSIYRHQRVGHNAAAIVVASQHKCSVVGTKVNRGGSGIAPVRADEIETQIV